jgi:hypothetical protein
LTQQTGKIAAPLARHIAPKCPFRPIALPLPHDRQGQHFFIAQFRPFPPSPRLIAGKLLLVQIADDAVHCRQEGVQIDVHGRVSFRTSTLAHLDTFPFYSHQASWGAACFMCTWTTVLQADSIVPLPMGRPAWR